jgi:AraC family transcriptional regulator
MSPHSEYSKRMNRVLDYIDAHLDAPLDLPTLAEVAHFSPFHFHRVFAAWMDETLGDYLRRRRLEVAAIRLSVNPNETILNIALTVGFGSGEAFARAFKRHFDETQSGWQAGSDARHSKQLADMRHSRNLTLRKLGQTESNLGQAIGKTDQAQGKENGEHTDFAHLTLESTLNVQLKSLPAARIAYMRHIGPYGPAVGQFWMQTFVPWMAAHNLFTYPRYGIGHDDPSITPAEKCRYDACVEVPADFVATGQALVTTLPGGRYALAAFEGTSEDIGPAWMRMFREWIPANGMQPDARPCFEYYAPDAKYDPATGVFACDICVPVRPL